MVRKQKVGLNRWPVLNLSVLNLLCALANSIKSYVLIIFERDCHLPLKYRLKGATCICAPYTKYFVILFCLFPKL